MTSGDKIQSIGQMSSLILLTMCHYSIGAFLVRKYAPTPYNFYELIPQLPSACYRMTKDRQEMSGGPVPVAIMQFTHSEPGKGALCTLISHRYKTHMNWIFVTSIESVQDDLFQMSELSPTLEGHFDTSF